MQALLRLITFRRPPRNQNEFGWTELHEATWQGNHTALSKCIKMQPALLNQANIYGVTALHLAVRWNRIKCLDILIQQSHIDVNRVDEDGWTPLHDAASLGRLKCIEMLLNHSDVNINVLDANGLTPVYLTTRDGHAECLKLLIQKNPESINFINYVGCNLLHNLVRYGRSDCLETVLLHEDIDVNIIDAQENTPLHYAALFGRTTCLNLLIDKGCADVNLANLFNITPLHLATAKGKSECALKLLNCPNVNVNIQGQFGFTPLQFAIDWEDINVIELLIDKKQARTDLPDVNGWTCEHQAAAESKIHVLKILDRRNLINMYRVTKHGQTVLSFAYQHKRVLKFFMKMHDKYGLSIIHHAAIQHKNKLFHLLLNPRRRKKRISFPLNEFNSRYIIKGRNTELSHLHATLEKNKKVSIFGPGGIGKTALVKYYAWSHQRFYNNNLFWIDCQTQDSIRKSFITVAKCIRIQTNRYEADGDLSSIVKDVLVQLKKKSSIIIFNNISDINCLTWHLYDIQNIHVVYISRKNIFSATEITCINLKPVFEAAGIEFFDALFEDKILTENNREDITLLTKTLMCIPLCLVTAKLYILHEYKNVDLKKYLQELEAEQRKLPYIKEYVANEYEKIIYSTLIVSLNKYKIYDLIATSTFLDPEYFNIKTLMQLGSIIYPKNILMQKVRHCISNSFINIINNKICINSYVRNLIKFHPYYKVNQSECYRIILKFLLSGDYTLHHEHVFKFGFEDNSTFIDVFLEFRSFNIIKPLVRYNFIKSLTYLFKYLPSMNRYKTIEIVKKYKLLHEAVKSGNIQTVIFIYEFDNNIRRSDDMGHTMIWTAIDKNYTDILNFLISQGASFKHIDKLNKTPLHRAAFLGKTEVVKLLLEQGIDPNVRNKFQRTPLHYAAMEGHNDVIEELLKNKDIDIDARDHYRRSPVFETVRCFQIESLKLFITKGAKINTKDNLDLSPVRLAKLQKHKKEFLDVFREYGYYSESVPENTCNFIC